MIEGYEVKIRTSALGELWPVSTVRGPAVKILARHGDYDPCQHIISASEARQLAAALVDIAEEIDRTVREDQG